MGIFRGPNIVTDGLVFAVDPGSTRSYPGSGTTTTNIIILQIMIIKIVPFEPH